MADKCNCCSVNNVNTGNVKDKVCIHTDKVYDSCREKDCLEDLRVYLTRAGQEIADRAISVKIKSAEIIWVYSDVEPVAFNKGYYTVSVKYFFKNSFGSPCRLFTLYKPIRALSRTCLSISVAIICI